MSNNYSVGKYGWGNFGGLESSLVTFEREMLDPFITPYITGYTINVGCGPDKRGDVRLDIEETEATTIIGDACRLPYNDGAFTTSLVIGVLHHISNYEKALSEACRVSNKYVVGREPNILNLQVCTVRSKLGLGGECPIYIPKARREFEKNGFRLLTERWDYGIKLLGTLTKAHNLAYKLDFLVPKQLRAFWSYVYERV